MRPLTGRPHPQCRVSWTARAAGVGPPEAGFGPVPAATSESHQRPEVQDAGAFSLDIA